MTVALVPGTREPGRRGARGFRLVRRRRGGAASASFALSLLSLFAFSAVDHARAWPSDEHRCIHDTHVAAHHDHSLRAHPHPPSVHGAAAEASAIGDDALGIDAARGGSAGDSAGRSKGQNQRSQELSFPSTQPISIEYRYLVSPSLDPFACRAAGQEVIIGSTATPSEVCKTTSEVTCTYECTAEDVMTDAKEAYLREVLKDTAALFASTLRVFPEPGDGLLRLPNPGISCGAGSYGTEIPPDDATRAFNATYVMYVTARPILGTTLAFASACAGQYESQVGRPVAGYINFSPSRIVVNDPGLVTIARHEATHALGFSYGLMGRYKPPYSTFSGSVFEEIEVERDNWEQPIKRTQTFVVSPTVKKEVEAHFGCTDGSLEGAELEGGGGAGTALSHWEQRIFGVEYMVGAKSASPVYSRVTFALLQDTGWYYVDFNSPLLRDVENPWGRGLGCDFARKSCISSSWKALGAPYYCTSSEEGCSVSHAGTAVCDIIQWEGGSIPVQFQYYTKNDAGVEADGSRGGGSQLMDYCPVLTRSRTCSVEADGKPDPEAYLKGRGEKYGIEPSGAAGRCFDSTLLDDDIEFRPFRDGKRSFGCYMSHCRTSNEVMVRVKEHWYPCRKGITISNVYGDMDGELTCPDGAVICQGTEEDTTWPMISAVEPTTLDRKAGQTVTVRGTNMGSTASVDVSGGPCIISSVSATEVVCVTGDEGYSTTEDFVRVANSLGVGSTTARGQVSVKGDLIAFIGKLEQDCDFGVSALTTKCWVWVAAGGALFVALLVCCFVSWRRRKKIRRKRQEIYDQRARNRHETPMPEASEIGRGVHNSARDDPRGVRGTTSVSSIAVREDTGRHRDDHVRDLYDDGPYAYDDAAYNYNNNNNNNDNGYPYKNDYGDWYSDGPRRAWGDDYS